MSAFDDVIQHGITLVHDGHCPACDATGEATELVREQPAGFHYHGETFVDPPYLWCPVDGQGYRLAGEDDGSTSLRILSPCNGGLHPDGGVGYR